MWQVHVCMIALNCILMQMKFICRGGKCKKVFRVKTSYCFVSF